MREMRRKDKEIGTDETINLLTECEYGVLSTVDNDAQLSSTHQGRGTCVNKTHI